MKILVEKSSRVQKTEKKNCKINWRTKQAVAVGHFLSSRITLRWMGPVHWRHSRHQKPMITVCMKVLQKSDAIFIHLQCLLHVSYCQNVHWCMLILFIHLHQHVHCLLLHQTHLLKSLLAAWYHLAGGPQSLHLPSHLPSATNLVISSLTSPQHSNTAFPKPPDLWTQSSHIFLHTAFTVDTLISTHAAWIMVMASMFG